MRAASAPDFSGPSAAVPASAPRVQRGFSRGIHLVATPEDAAALVASGELDGGEKSFLLAQPYMPNNGDDIKVYNAGGRIFAVRRPSPLSGRAAADEVLEVTPELRRLVERIGRVFSLEIYGVDVVKTADGWVAIDVNDFPSFSMVPEAVAWIAATIVEVAREKLQRPAVAARPAPRVTAGRPRRSLSVMPRLVTRAA